LKTRYIKKYENTDMSSMKHQTEEMGGEEKDESFDYSFKLLLVGDIGVGKSSILNQLVDEGFDDHQKGTIGVDFKTKFMTMDDGKRVKLTIWDRGLRY